MTKIEALDFDLDARNDGDLESKATRVELGDNFVVISNDLENGDPFFVVLCNKPLHMCEQTFEDNWGNTWYRGV